MSWKMRQVRRCGRKNGLDELKFLVAATPQMDSARFIGYLFRRFGYPERGWDGYKEACAYYLTTPDKQLILGIRLTACTDPRININFYADYDLCAEIRGDNARAEWRKSMRVWFRENREYPPWFDDFVRYLCCRMDPPPPEGFKIVPEDREVALFDHAVWYCGGVRKGEEEIANRAGAFYDEVWNAYKKIQPRPETPRRAKNWRRWADDDPLKPLADAAEKALLDLRRPVRVRDQAIDAYGKVRGDNWVGMRCVNEPKSAGYAPFGTFINADPELACELTKAVGAFGKNNRRAMQKAIEVLKAAAPKPHKKKGSQSAEEEA